MREAASGVVVLAIGGSDPSGGAGIQADLKTIHALGAYGLSAITAVTAQDGREVRSTRAVEPDALRTQLEVLFQAFSPAAIKTGMLADAGVVAALCDVLEARRASGAEAIPLVVDPVLASTSGRPLLDSSGVELLAGRLLPRTRVCTPNWPEAAILGGCPVNAEEEAVEAARRILQLGCAAVVVKGGHGSGEESADWLVTEKAARRFASRRAPVAGAHGTGCAFASALATGLALGDSLEAAVSRAKDFVTGALEHPLLPGRTGPMLDHFHAWLGRAHSGGSGGSVRRPDGPNAEEGG